MKKWCGIKKSRNGKYVVIVPMSSEFISDDMMIYDEKVSGKSLTKYFNNIEEAKLACIEFNDLYAKYNV